MIDYKSLKEATSKLTILYVEDNLEARKLTSSLLKRLFKEILIAKDGHEGLFLYLKNKPDLIISDISMPKMNGIELIRTIKRVNKFQRVIIFSAYSEVKYLMQAIDLGVDGFIFKPVDREKFLELLYKLSMQVLSTKQNQEYKLKLEDLVRQRTEKLESRNKDLKNMLKELRKSKELKEQMKIAQKVQKNFLPESLPSTDVLDFAPFFEAAHFIGGDYYDCFFSEDKNLLNIIIADVSGHGVGPAINMSSFRGLCKSILSGDRSFDKQVEKINSVICDDSKKNNFFITAFFIKFDIKTREISYISAGHNDIIYYKKDEQNFEELKSTSIPLGIFDSTSYAYTRKKINAGDFIFLYTDGLIEATNKDEEMFTLKKVKDNLEKNKNKNIKEILDDLVLEYRNFISDLENTDDTTILISQFK